MALELITSPVTEPLSLAETKTYLNVTGTSHDNRILELIKALRESCEAYTQRALITQTLRLWLDAFPVQRQANLINEGVHNLPVDFEDRPLRSIEISRPPLQSVTHIKTYAPDNTASVFSASSYFVDSVSQPGRVVLNANANWPTNLRSANAVEVEFVAGYGTATDVPRPLPEGMLLWLKLLFRDQTWLLEAGDPVPGLKELNLMDLPPQVGSLWQPYRISSL